jgi:hypothetical protein
MAVTTSFLITARHQFPLNEIGSIIVVLVYICSINTTAMKRILLFALLLAAMNTIAQEATDSIPDWFKNPPTSSRKFYGAGEGTSMSLDIAEKKAMLNANLRLAEQVKPPKVKEIKSTTKRVDGSNKEEIIQRTIVEAKLKGVTIINKSVTQKGDMYVVYILVEMKK